MLFFETEGQGSLFVCFCLLGFLFALLIDVEKTIFRNQMRVLGDILILILCGLFFAFSLFLLKADQLRLFHWLGLLVGAILYLCGLRRFVTSLLFRLKKIRKTKE